MRVRFGGWRRRIRRAYGGIPLGAVSVRVIRLLSMVPLALALMAAGSPAKEGPAALQREFDRLTERVVSGDPGRSMLAEIPAALALAERYRLLGDGAKEGASFVTASNLAQLGGDYRRAVGLADRGRPPCARAGEWVCVGRADNTAAVALGRLEDPYAAMRRLRRASATFARARRADLAQVTRVNAANIQADLGDARGALAEYRAIDARYAERDDPDRTGLLTTIGNLLLELREPRGARDAALETIRILEAKRPSQRSGWTSDQGLAALETLGLAEAYLGNAPASLRALRRYVAAAAAGDSDFERYESAYAMAKALTILGRAGEARPFLRRALALATEPDTAGRIALYDLAARTMRADGDATAAFDWLLQAKDERDRQLAAQVRSSLADAFAATNVAERDAALVRTRDEAEAAAWRTRAWTLTGVALVLLLAGVAYLRLRTVADRRRQRAVLEERNRMARQVHDGILQSLTGLSLGVQAVRRRLATDAGAVGPMLDELAGDVRRALVDARDGVWDLRSTDPDGIAFEKMLAGAGRRVR